MRRITILTAAAAAIVLAAAAIIYSKEPDNHAAQQAPAAQAFLSIIQAGNFTTPPNTPNPTPQHGMELSIAKGLVDSNPYAIVTELRNRKTIGSFGAAHEISIACKRAYKNVYIAKTFGLGGAGLVSPGKGPMLPVSSSDLSPYIESRRIAAMQEIMARCQPFFDDRSIESPLTGDQYGNRFDIAQKRAESIHLPQFPQQALQELASQGLLASAIDRLVGLRLNSPYFDGKLVEDRDAFRRAALLAKFNMTMSTSADRQDLHSLNACVFWGVCDGSPEQIALRDIPAESASRNEIIALAKKVQQAFEIGNVSAFAPPPK